MGRYFAGIDIRSHGVAAVLLRRTLKGICFESQAYVPLPGPEDTESPPVPALKLLQQKIDLTDATCVVSFPANRFYFRNLELPFKEAGKIGQALPFELEPTLPCPLEAMVINFVPLQRLSHQGNYPVLAAAADSCQLQSWLALYAAAGLTPHFLLPGGISEAAALQSLDQVPDECVLIDLSDNTLTMLILSRKEVSMIRSFPLMLFHAGDENTAARISGHLRHTIASFGETREEGFSPAKIFLAGDLESDQELAARLSGALGIQAESLQLAERLRAPILHLPATGWNSGRMDGALALALAGARRQTPLNFRQGPLALKNRWLAYKTDLLKTGALAAAVLLFALANCFLNTAALQRRIETLDQQMVSIFKSTYPEITRIQDPLSQMKINLRELKENTFSADASEPHVPAILAINTISSLIPQEIEVDLVNLVINPENIILTGHTDTFNSVETMKNMLEKAEFFKKVTISSATIDRSGKQVNFKLNIAL